MSLRRLFNASPKRLPGDRSMLGPVEVSPSTGVFITPQSLMTFPVASSVVAALWRLAEAVIPTWGKSKIVLVIIALLVGFFVWAISITDPDLKQTRRDKLISFGIALINSLYLAIAALGIAVTTTITKD